MNHFEAVEEMRRIATEKGLLEVEIEIDWNGSVCEGGRNVQGTFYDENGENGVRMFWDAAFQDMVINQLPILVR